MSSSSPASRKANWPPHLVLRGSRFYAQVRIPESLRGVVTAGKQTHLRETLRTSSEAEALRRLPVVVAKLKGQIEAARREPDGSRKGKDPAAPDVAADAACWREHLKAEGIAPARAFDDVAFSETIDKIAGEPLCIEIGEDVHHELPTQEPIDHIVGIVAGRPLNDQVHQEERAFDPVGGKFSVV